MKKESWGVGDVAASPRRSLTGNILITGGAGYLGRSILKRAHKDGWDARFTVLSRDEQKQHVVMNRWPDVRCVLGDIRNMERLQDIMWGHDLVIHTAALKYIPEAEFNVKECIDVNIDGSRAVMLAATGVVERVVALSTDKAVSPLNVYGATKMLMERLFVEQDQLTHDDGTRFNVVRYGNVIGSTGSVIPTFINQLTAGLDLNVTDPAMTRFWLTNDEAIDLIIEACSMEDRGVTVVPQCRAASLQQIIEAVEAMTGSLAMVNVSGLRPGEKPDESLINEAESTRTQFNDPYYYIMPQGHSGDLEPFEFSSANATLFDETELVEAIKASINV